MGSAYDRTKEWRSRPENKAKRAAEAQRWRARHPDIWKDIKARHRAKNVDAIRIEDAERQRKRRAADPEGQKRRTDAFKAKQRATQEAIAGRARPQVCDLCGGDQGGIVFDHCHASGDFRGWLCDRCNKVLGLVRDDAALLRVMAAHVGEGANGKANNGEAQRSPKEHVRDPRQARLSIA